MAGHPRRLLALLVVLVATGFLLGPATTAFAHVRPVLAAAPALVPQQPLPAATSQVTPVETPVAAPYVTVRVASIPRSASSAPLWAALVLAVLLGAAAVVPRRVLIAAVALLLLVAGFEASVHSVHHLADQRAAATCAVAAASAHVHGATDLLAVPEMWVPTPIGAVVASEPDRLGARTLRPDEGRAPPSA
jgi:hypothetical protein